MAQLKKRTSTLQQTMNEAAQAEQREQIRQQMIAELHDTQNKAANNTPATKRKNKTKTKAQTIAEKRPRQVSVHITEEENKKLNHLLIKAEDLGIKNPTKEDIWHGLLTIGLRTLKKQPDLLNKIINEDDSLYVSE